MYSQAHIHVCIFIQSHSLGENCNSKWHKHRWMQNYSWQKHTFHAWRSLFCIRPPEVPWLQFTNAFCSSHSSAFPWDAPLPSHPGEGALTLLQPSEDRNPDFAWFGTDLPLLWSLWHCGCLVMPACLCISSVHRSQMPLPLLSAGKY